MDKQMTITAFSDELAQVRTKKKRISQSDRADRPVGRMAYHDSAVLLQRRARQQTLSAGDHAPTVSAAKPL